MQAIATTNARADIEREGKKYGNLQQDLSFDDYNHRINNQAQEKSTYLSQNESFGNIRGYFAVGCNVNFTQKYQRNK